MQDTRSRRGNATVIVVLMVFVIGSLVAVVLTMGQRHSGEVRALSDQNRSFFVAQSGANAALADVVSGAIELADEGDQATLGSAESPVETGDGSYWVTLSRGAEGVITITSTARAGLQTRVLEVVAQASELGVYHNGIFAGNSSGDASYTLELSGLGDQADQIHGDVYSGGSVALHGDSEIFGTIRAYDKVTGKGSTSAETGRKQSIPDIAGMNYAATADIDVAEEFADGSAEYESNAAGGKAWQLGESNPAHIFRLNPSDRTSETSATVKDDYFLEDPYETVRSDSKSDGTNAYAITLSGTEGESGKDSNGKVFYVDGNLWIHNYQTMSLKFQHAESAGIQVTFVVKGNIYISDNLFYTNNKKDGVAFVAMKDPDVTDSGNVYFGDPKFGTLERMHAYLYAENNFYDVNLSATGSARVELFGNMTAGNQVKIRRDFDTTVDGKTVVQHSRLMVDFDERIANGELELPGLPRTPSGDDQSFEVLAWREVTPE